jgi:hypothetical protein
MWTYCCQGHWSVRAAVSCRLWVLHFVYKHSKNYVLPHGKHTASSLQMLLVWHSDALTVRTTAELLLCVTALVAICRCVLQTAQVFCFVFRPSFCLSSVYLNGNCHIIACYVRWAEFGLRTNVVQSVIKKGVGHCGNAWSTVLEKLVVTELVKFPAFYGNRRLITVFTVSWKLVVSIPGHSILIL